MFSNITKFFKSTPVEKLDLSKFKFPKTTGFYVACSRDNQPHIIHIEITGKIRHSDLDIMCIGTYREITDGAKVISITDISGKTNYRKTTCNQLNLKFKVGKEVVLSGNSRLPFYRGLIGAISHYAMNYPHEFFETKLLTDELKVALMTFVDSNGNIQYPHLFIFDEHTGMMEYEVFYNSNTGFLQKIVSRDGKKIIAVRVTAESVKSGVYNIRFHYSVFNDSIYSYDWYYNVNVRPSNIRFIQCVRRSLSI